MIGVLYDHELGLAQRLFDEVEVGHRRRWIGGHDPQGFDAAVANCLKKIDRLAAGLRSDGRRRPEILHKCAVPWVGNVHMGGKRIGETAHFTPAHRIGLAGQ